MIIKLSIFILEIHLYEETFSHGFVALWSLFVLLWASLDYMALVSSSCFFQCILFLCDLPLLFSVIIKSFFCSSWHCKLLESIDANTWPSQGTVRSVYQVLLIILFARLFVCSSKDEVPILNNAGLKGRRLKIELTMKLAQYGCIWK